MRFRVICPECLLKVLFCSCSKAQSKETGLNDWKNKNVSKEASNFESPHNKAIARTALHNSFAQLTQVVPVTQLAQKDFSPIQELILRAQGITLPFQIRRGEMLFRILMYVNKVYIPMLRHRLSRFLCVSFMCSRILRHNVLSRFPDSCKCFNCMCGSLLLHFQVMKFICFTF